MTIEKQLLYLLSKVDTMDGKELLKIYEAMNYTPQTIRNLLSKLKKEKYIVSVDRSVYSISSSGRDVIHSFYRKKNYYMEKWNEKWYIVLMEIPETERKKRDTFRRNLIQLGFGHLYKSVYIHPWDISHIIINMIDSLEIESYVTMLASSEFILNKISSEGSSGTNKASEIWNLEKINTLYKEKLDWFEQEFEPAINQLLKDKNPDILKIFTGYLRLGETINDLLLIDPMLPPEFSPKSWMGTNILDKFNKFHQSLANLIPKDSFYHVFLEKNHN
ncbi:PaaX family transcriptional regulator C-terminal domain-containing protein [Metabacillus fastidiosus]|uniref:PaaX family transcriptional regulator C-terminal domain-containing protein n=1 Tax=Metabacillus fastidiosus TaxID=1458 RepID=UPI002E1B2042|nr:PaaX family transcriptional regulator C-terminal domain-containing protein [Metabacillus fastidiosus]